MNELTDKIIGAIILGFTGLIAVFFWVIKERFKRWLKKIFGLNGSEPPEPKQPEPEPPKQIQSVVLIGHWSGQGWRYNLHGQLQRNQAWFEGQFEWTFIAFPPDYPHKQWAKNRVGRVGIEFVKGMLAAEKLTLSGYKVVDPDGLGLLVGDYTIEINELVGSFAGTSITQSTKETGSVAGTIAVQR